MSDGYYVPRDYEMDPETEVLIRNGYCLRSGMIVLIASPSHRIRDDYIAKYDERWRKRVLLRHTTRPAGVPPSYDVFDPTYSGAGMETIREALKLNRWCEVSRLKLHVKAKNFRDYIGFRGFYADGSAFSIYMSVDEPWIAKKESIRNAGLG